MHSEDMSSTGYSVCSLDASSHQPFLSQCIPTCTSIDNSNAMTLHTSSTKKPVKPPILYKDHHLLTPIHTVFAQTPASLTNGLCSRQCFSAFPYYIRKRSSHARLTTGDLIPYSGFYLRGPNFCEICEVLTSSQILIL